MSKAKSRRILNLLGLAIAAVLWSGVAALLLVVLNMIFPDIFRERSSDHPRVQVQVKSLPSVKEAILQSIELSTPLQFFGDEFRIVAYKKSDESIKVKFSKTIGESDLRPLFEVDITVSDTTSIKWSNDDLVNHRVDDPESVALSRALMAVLSDHVGNTKSRYQAEVFVGKIKDGFGVLLTFSWDPYYDGDHCSYTLSKDFQIIDVGLGA